MLGITRTEQEQRLEQLCGRDGMETVRHDFVTVGYRRKSLRHILKNLGKDWCMIG